MDFLDLQRRLRADGHDPYLAYDGRHDPFLGALRARGIQSAYCRGAWMLYALGDRFVVTVRDLLRPDRYPPDRTGPEPAEFRTEAEACAYLWEVVSARSAPGSVRPVGFDQLPDAVTAWIAECGCAPRTALFGNPLLTQHSTESYYAVRVGDRYELRLRSNLPPTVGDPVHTSPDLDDVCRVLMSLVGDWHAPRPLGWPQVGIAHRTPARVRAERLAGADFAAVAGAYRAERGEPLLDVLAEGAAVRLVTPDILRLAEERDLAVQRFDDGRSATFGFWEGRYRIRETAHGYLLECAPERSNTFSVLVGSASLEEVQREFLRVLARR